MSAMARQKHWTHALETGGAWLLAVIWMLPLLYAFWSAFHPPEFATRFELLAPLTLENFKVAWSRAPFARYFLNTFILVTMILIAQFILCTLAAYAFARFDFPGKSLAFVFVLLQLMIMPEVLIVENYVTMSKLGAVDTIVGIGLPYMASAFGIFLLRQTFKTIPKELEEAARIDVRRPAFYGEYMSLWRSRFMSPTVCLRCHHEHPWPLVITNSVETRPLTVGWATFGAPGPGIGRSSPRNVTAGAPC